MSIKCRRWWRDRVHPSHQCGRLVPCTREGVVLYNPTPVLHTLVLYLPFVQLHRVLRLPLAGAGDVNILIQVINTEAVRCTIGGGLLYSPPPGTCTEVCSTKYRPLYRVLHLLHAGAGGVNISVQAINAGGVSSLEELTPTFMLQSPSAECNQLLRIADLQSVAIREEGFAPQPLKRSASTDAGRHLCLRMSNAKHFGNMSVYFIST